MWVKYRIEYDDGSGDVDIREGYMELSSRETPESISDWLQEEFPADPWIERIPKRQYEIVQSPPLHFIKSKLERTEEAYRYWKNLYEKFTLGREKTSDEDI